MVTVGSEISQRPSFGLRSKQDGGGRHGRADGRCPSFAKSAKGRPPKDVEVDRGLSLGRVVLGWNVAEMGRRMLRPTMARF